MQHFSLYFQAVLSALIVAVASSDEGKVTILSPYYNAHYGLYNPLPYAVAPLPIANPHIYAPAFAAPLASQFAAQVRRQICPIKTSLGAST